MLMWSRTQELPWKNHVWLLLSLREIYTCTIRNMLSDLWYVNRYSNLCHLFIYLSIYWSFYLLIYLFTNKKGYKLSSGSRAGWKENHGAYFKIRLILRRSNHCLRSLGLSGNRSATLCQVIYQSWDAMFRNQMKLWTRGVSSGDETLGQKNVSYYFSNKTLL